MYNLDGCNFTETTIQATTAVYFLTYYVVLPHFMTIGLLLDVLLIVALIRQTKQLKGSYGYQLQSACCRTFHCLVFGANTASAYWWAGQGGDATADWFVRNYWLVWTTMRFMPHVINAAYFLSLFLSVAIPCERVYSLARPIAYKLMNHRLYQSVVGVTLIALATGLMVDKYFGTNIVGVEINGTVIYQSQVNTDYVWGLTFESVRMNVHASCLILLLVANVSMIILHRRRIKRIESMTISNEERIQARRETHKDLTILAACQSAMSCFDHSVNMVCHMLRKWSPYWTKCGYVVIAEMNLTIMLVGLGEFVLFAVVNRRLRMSIPGYKYCAMFYSWACGGNNRVGTITQQ